jgi:16S rRNA (cytosine1402-N4)-methyltransferase
MVFAHLSVMTAEVMQFLRPEPHRRYVDGTLGGGGHAEQILIQSSPDGQVLGLDWDDEAIVAAQERLSRFGKRLIVQQASFTEAKKGLSELGWQSVDGVVLDLGVSSHQLESNERGFSFRAHGRLDMRMDRRQSLDAYQIINAFSVAELERIFRAYGEEPQARRIAAAIIAARNTRTIETPEELAQIVVRAKAARRRDHHPATQAFQALRIAVNQELQQLQHFLERGYDLLGATGRMVIISFHSLEDRLVKSAFRKWGRECICPPRTPRCNCGWSRKVKILTKRPVMPSANEISANPRARSAKLRAVERI